MMFSSNKLAPQQVASKMTDDQVVALSSQFLSVLNTLRNRLGYPPFMLANGVIKFMTKLVECYEFDDWQISRQGEIDESALNYALDYIYGDLFTIPSMYQLGDEYCLSTPFNEQIFSSSDLQGKVINNLFVEAINEPFMLELINKLATVDKGDQDYLGVAFDKFGALHFGIIYTVHRDYLFKYDKHDELLTYDGRNNNPEDLFRFADVVYDIPSCSENYLPMIEKLVGKIKEMDVE